LSFLGDKSRPTAIQGAAYDVLPGFKKAVAPSTNRKRYPPPQLPRDFKPFHTFDTDSSITADVKNDKRKLDAYSRGAALGEVPHLSTSQYVRLCVFMLLA